MTNYSISATFTNTDADPNGRFYALYIANVSGGIVPKTAFWTAPAYHDLVGSGNKTINKTLVATGNNDYYVTQQISSDTPYEWTCSLTLLGKTKSTYCNRYRCKSDSSNAHKPWHYYILHVRNSVVVRITEKTCGSTNRYRYVAGATDPWRLIGSRVDETEPVYLNFLGERKKIYDPQEWKFQKRLRNTIKPFYTEQKRRQERRPKRPQGRNHFPSYY